MENMEQLIEQANCIESETERVRFVMNYFLNTVQYDYTYLLVKGYLGDSISEYDPQVQIETNPFSKGKISLTQNGVTEEYDDSFCLSLNITKGESKLLDKIIEFSKTSNKDYEKFKKMVSSILEEELRKHIDNEEIVKISVERFIEKISNDKEQRGRIIENQTGKYFVKNSIKKLILQYLVEPNKHFPPLIENGLIKRGVCQHYADYLSDLLPKIGIMAKRIDGTSELGHAWIAAIIDGECKSIDLTRAIFIRDGFKGIPLDQKSEDWLIADFEDTFKMQNTRTITGIGLDENGESIPTPYVINGTNFNRKEFIELIRDKNVSLNSK